MRIVIDARMLRSTGIGRYLAELIERVPALDPGTDYTVLLRRDDLAGWEPPAPNVTAVEADWGIYSWQAQLQLPRLLRRLAPDLVHFPHFNVPLLHRGRRVVTIQDLTMVEHRNVRADRWHRLLYPVKHRLMLRTLRSAVERSSALMTSTGYVRDEVVSRYRVPNGVTVVPYGVPVASVAPRSADAPLGPGGRYLLYVGNFYPYKNLGVVVDALARLAPTDAALRVVLVGAVDAFADDLRARAAARGVLDRVVFTGYVPDAELSALYRGASLFVFPSLSEGFGFPGLEAMAHGVPVVAARASCLPEVYGDAAAWFDPADESSLARVVARLLEDQDERRRLVDAGHRRVSSLSWARMAAGTLEVYRQAVRGAETAAHGVS